MKPSTEVKIFANGSCLGNPGPGGYSSVIREGTHEEMKILTGGFCNTTNNRMALMGPIKGVEYVKTPSKIMVCSNSKYFVDAMTKGWVRRWKGKNWWRSKTEKASSIDLWKRLLKACEPHEVKFVWMSNRTGNNEGAIYENLAKEAAKQWNLPVDHGYEQLSCSLTINKGDSTLISMTPGRSPD